MFAAIQDYYKIQSSNAELIEKQIIQREIEKLDEGSASNWKRLYDQVGKYKQLNWNLAQKISLAATRDNSVIYDEWGRGTGKTAKLCKVIIEAAETMPRGLGVFSVPTYAMYETEIMSSIKSGLEQNNRFEGLHYFVAKAPPRNFAWATPYKSPTKFDRTIYWHTGFVWVIASADANNASVGMSSDIQVSDETALLDWQFLGTVVMPTVRGSASKQVQKDFQRNSPYFLRHLFHSSTPMLPSGQELLLGLESGAYADELKKMGIGGVKVIRANYKFNKANLADSFAEQMKVVIPDQTTYNAQILNIRPPSVSGGFYTGLSQTKHCYRPLYSGFTTPDCRADSDIRPLPLLLAIDWGAKINCCITAQRQGRELRCLKNHFVLGANSEMQDDLARKWCDYYEYHTEKTVEIFYDPTGNNETGNTRKTRIQQFSAILVSRGWRVILRTRGGKNELHDRKKLLIDNVLSETYAHYPILRINELNCAALFVSMKNAPAKSERGVIKKDKSSERKDSILPQHATHLSDALDTLIVGLFSSLLFQSRL